MMDRNPLFIVPLMLMAGIIIAVGSRIADRSTSWAIQAIGLTFLALGILLPVGVSTRYVSVLLLLEFLWLAVATSRRAPTV